MEKNVDIDEKREYSNEKYINLRSLSKIKNEVTRNLYIYIYIYTYIVTEISDNIVCTYIISHPNTDYLPQVLSMKVCDGNLRTCVRIKISSKYRRVYPTPY